nr:LysM domain-containing protein [Ligilactobacillus salivarius]
MKLNKTLLSLTAATGIIATGAAANGAKADKITVKSGDTVSQLALDHATTVDNVQQLNNLENVDLIFVGQTLEMGDGSYTTTTYQTASQYQQNYAQNTDAQANYTQTDYSAAQNNVPATTFKILQLLLTKQLLLKIQLLKMLKLMLLAILQLLKHRLMLQILIKQLLQQMMQFPQILLIKQQLL